MLMVAVSALAAETQNPAIKRTTAIPMVNLRMLHAFQEGVLSLAEKRSAT